MLTINHLHQFRMDPTDPAYMRLLAALTGMQSRMDAAMVDISKLTSDITALTAAVTAVDNDLTGLRSQIASLTAQLAAGNPITQAQIDSLDSAVAQAVSNLNAQVAQDQPAPAPAASTSAPTEASTAEPTSAPAAAPPATAAPSSGLTTDAPSGS